MTGWPSGGGRPAAVVLAVVVVAAVVSPLLVAAVGDNVHYDSVTPSTSTTLHPGDTYTWDVTAGYFLDTVSSAEIRLVFEGSSISNNVRDAVTVSGSEGSTSLSGTLTVPSDWDTSKDLQVTLWMVDSNGNTLDTYPKYYDVDSPNNPPSIDDYSPSDTAYEVSVGTSETYSVSASDPDGDSLTYTWTVNDHNDGSGQYQVGTGTSHTHAWDTVGDYTLRAKVNDGTTTVTQSWTVSVTDSTTPPTVTTDSPTSVDDSRATLQGVLDNTGSAGSADVYFEYRESGTSTWQTTATRTLSGASGFSETVSGLSAGTTYEYRAVATSADGTDTGGVVRFDTDPTGSVRFDSVTPSPGTQLTPGETYTVDVSAGYSLSSASGGEIRLLFEGISASAEDVTAVSSGSGTAALSASLTVPSDWNTNDDLEITLEFVSGNGDSLHVQTEPYDVTSSNTPPSVDDYSPTDQAYEVANGTTESYSVSASDADGDALSYTWSINDLNDDADPSQVATGTGYTHTFDRTGDFSIRVAVNDGETTVEEVWTVSVAPRDGDASPTADRRSPASSSHSVLAGEVAAFEVEVADPDADLDRVEWAVDGTVVHTAFLGGESPANASLERSFSTAGTYTVTATVADENGNADAVSWTVAVGDDASAPAAVTTGDATDVGRSSATLAGSLDDPGEADEARVWFEYRRRGTDEWLTTPERILTGTGRVSTPVSGLAPETTYEFRVVARTTAGSATGDVRTLTTAPGKDGPGVTVLPAATSPAPGALLDAGAARVVLVAVRHDLPRATPATVELLVGPLGLPVAATDVVGTGDATLAAVVAVPDGGELRVRVALVVDGRQVDVANVEYPVETPSVGATRASPADRSVEATAGETASFAVAASADGGRPTRVEWRVDGTVAATRSLGAGDLEDTLDHAFEDTGSHTVTAVVHGDDGTTAAATWRVTVSRRDDGDADVPKPVFPMAEGQAIACRNACRGPLKRAVLTDDGTIVCIDWAGALTPGAGDAIGLVTPSVGPIGLPPVITVPYYEVDERDCMF